MLGDRLTLDASSLSGSASTLLQKRKQAISKPSAKARGTRRLWTYPYHSDPLVSCSPSAMCFYCSYSPTFFFSRPLPHIFPLHAPQSLAASGSYVSLLISTCRLTDGHLAEDMNLSNLLHRGQQNPRQQDTPRSSQSFPDPRSRLPHDHRQDMASALTASPYISQSPIYIRSPQPPPSPPIDEPSNLRTLPSIQSLIGMDVPPPNDEQHCWSSSRCS